MGEAYEWRYIVNITSLETTVKYENNFRWQGTLKEDETHTLQ